MTAQIYNTKRNNFFRAFIPEEFPYSYEFYLGEFVPWVVIKNNDEFISLGGSRENPIIYKFQETGITDFTFSILSPTFAEQRNIPDLKEWTMSSLAYYELWIDGIKPYYFYFDRQSERLFTQTVSVYGIKGQTTKFKFRLTLHFISPNPYVNKFYFEGKEDIVCSSITAKYIPDITIEEKKSPIVLTADTKLAMNQRYITKVPVLKTIYLTLDENCKVGDFIEIKNMDMGNFQINTGDNIDIVMDGRTTRLKNGYIKSTKMGDFLRLECMESSPKIIFSDIHNIGTFTII